MSIFLLAGVQVNVDLKRSVLIGNTLTYAASFLPALILALESPRALMFNDFYSAATSIAKICALGGIGLYSVNVLLSSRNRYLDQIYGGLDNVYVIHHDKGLIAFILLVVHPTFLALRLAEDSFMEVLLFLLPSDSPAINLGKLSLVLFSLVIALTIWGRLEYQRLMRAHKSLGVIFLLGALHAFTVGSDVSSLIYLKTYVGALIALAVLAYVNTTVLGNMAAKKFVYVVDKVESPYEGLVSIDQRPKGEKMAFEAGQFVYPTFHQEGLEESHPFSVTSKNSDDELSLLIRPLGDFTARLRGLETGTEVTVEGPYGGFNYRKGGEKQIWVAGGIGVTPFIGMARSLEDDPSHPSVDMYYSYRGEGDEYLCGLMRALLLAYESCRFYEFNTSRTGRITVEKVSETSNLKDVDVYLCGPKEMLEDLRRQFTRHGVKPERIHIERFRLLT